MEIIKRSDIIKGSINEDTKILAQSLYSTYITNVKNTYICANIDKFYRLFGLEDNAASLKKIVAIFVDLTEPIMIDNFEFRNKKYKNIILSFCTFDFIQKSGVQLIEIQINEMYLEALKRYILNPYLEV